MMIKVGNGYLDFDSDVDVERQIKLFEEIETSNGDYSYTFELPATSNNLKLLGFPFPDNASKITYTKIEAEIINNGLTVYSGYLRIETINGYLIQCSFYSGNNNWFSLLSGLVSDVDFSDLDIDQTVASVIASASNTSGVVFPIIDSGPLVTRSYAQLKIEDFVAGIYVHSVLKRIFAHHEIKIQGELINDPLFNQLITVKNSKSEDQIASYSSFINSPTTTSRPLENTHYKVFFTESSPYPYYNGAAGAFDPVTSTYTATHKTTIDLEVNLKPAIIDSSYNNRIYIYINGAYTFVDVGLPVGAGGLYNSGNAGTKDPFTIIRTITLEAGDVMEIYAEWQQSLGSTQNDVLSGTIKITPTFIYRAFGNDIVPNWTQQKYVSNIMRLFNVLPSFDPNSKTLTLNLFDKIKLKDPIDLSEYISNTSVDYVDFISSYGKKNLFSYNQIEFDDLRDYNIFDFFTYNEGVIESNNQFLNSSEKIVEVDFSSSIGYVNPALGMSVERTDLISLETHESIDATTVTDFGFARFNIASNIFKVGDLVRISESTNPVYNGDWVVLSQASGYVEFLLFYDSDATAKLTKLNHTYNSSDDVYLLINVPNYSIGNMSTFRTALFLDGTSINNASVAFFSLVNLGEQINSTYKQSLSFGEIPSGLFYQRTIISEYWSVFEGILNDPVKLICTMNLPLHIFINIDFLRPITIKTLKSSNLYYANKISGYRSSSQSCTVELIKLP